MAALPYLKFYPSDYLSDTSHLTTLEHGAYLLLIFTYWQRGDSFRANDERTLNKRLATVARLSNEEWECVRETLSEFFTCSPTEWRHERIETDLQAVLSKSETNSRAGKASAERRKARNKNDNSTNDERTFDERSTDEQRNANHTDTDTDTDTEKKKKTSSSKKAPAGFEQFWLAYPNKSAKANAEKAFSKIGPDQDLLDRIMSGLTAAKRSRDWVKDGGQYIPHAATWLNGERWLDEYTPASRSSVDEDVFAGCI